MEELSLGEQVTALAQRIATEKLAPRAAELDRQRAFPWENVQTLGEAGFCGVSIAEAAGGLGLGRAAFAAVVRELAKACASTALVYVAHAVVAKAIEVAGSEAAKHKWLAEMLSGQSLGAFAIHEAASGCNEAAIITHAKKDGDTYILNGSKFFVTSGGEAHIYLVLARTDLGKGSQGMSMLLVEKDAPGLSFGRAEDTMGLTSTSSREVFFSDCRVPTENLVGREGQGLQVQGRAIAGWGLFGAAAISAGIAASATDLAAKHARERTIAGQPIAAHQAVQMMIADMVLGSEVAKDFLDTCARKADRSPDSAVSYGFKAKLLASETAVEVTNQAIQVLGGHGYCRDYTVERLFRDARGLMLHFKTSEGLRLGIGRAVTGV